MANNIPREERSLLIQRKTKNMHKSGMRQKVIRGNCICPTRIAWNTLNRGMPLK